MRLTRNNLHIVQNYLDSSAPVGTLPDAIIDSVTPNLPVPADYGTAFEDLDLPLSVTVQLDNATEDLLPVVWGSGGYSGNVPGAHDLIGTITLPDGIQNPAGVVAAVRVIVAEQVLDITDLEEFADIEVEEGTPFSETGLPSAVVATLTGDTSQAIAVTWSEGPYDELTPGTYNIQGQLVITDPNITNTQNKQPSINIVVTAITPVNRVIVSAAAQSAITTPYNTAFASLPLPAQVAATLDDGTVVLIDTQWIQGSYSPTTPGTYNLSANFLNLPANVVNTNNVHPSKSVQVLVQTGGEDGVQVKKLLGTNGSPLGYLQWLPQDYSANPSKQYPVIFFLHGAGERGLGDTSVSLDKVTANGPPKHIKNGHKMEFINPVSGLTEKFIVISPQTNSWIWFSQGMNFIKWVLDSGMYRIDPARVHVTGLSMGGHGAWENLATNANTTNVIASIVPICPGATPNWDRGDICFTKGIKVWAFHCTHDPTANVYNTQRPMGEIAEHTTIKTEFGADAADDLPNYLVTYYPDATAPGVDLHFTAWDRAYRTNNAIHTPNIYQWMLTKTKA